MRITPFILALWTLVVSSTAWGAQQVSQERFDFIRINATIENAMNDVVAVNGRFSRFNYRFDPEATSVDQDRYALQMEVAGKAPWSKAGFESRGFVVVDHDPQGRSLAIHAMVDLEVRTDTLAMIRHLAATSDRCPLSDKVEGVLRVALSEDCKIQMRLMKVNSMSDLYQILGDHLTSSHTTLVAYRNDVRKAMEGAITESLRHSLAQQEHLAETLIASVQNAQLLWNDQGISVSVANFSLLGIAQHKSVKIQFEHNALRVEGDVTMTGRSTLFMAAKPEFLSMLRDMEEGAESAKRLIQMESGFWMRLIGNRLVEK